MTPYTLKPCPFCAFRPSAADPDCIYPAGTDGRVWRLHCYESGGGCGASILGDSAEDCIAKWNARAMPALAAIHSAANLPPSNFDGAVLRAEDGRYLAEFAAYDNDWLAAVLALPSGVIVPAEPPLALLVSMALRIDHGLGVPGYYDQALFGQGGATHAQRLEMAVNDMRKVYEEMTGRGFYSHRRRESYLSLIQSGEQ